MIITSEFTDFTAFLFRSHMISLQLMEMTSKERMVVFFLFEVIVEVVLIYIYM